MRRNLLSFAIAAALVAVPTLASAAAPFGFFDPEQVPGIPGASGVIGMHGWALDDDGIRAVDIYVDGAIAGRAIYGDHRPGVASLFPGFPDSEAAGFVFQLDTTHYLNGLHTIDAQAISHSGERRFLNSLVFQFVNTTHNLVPFGKIDDPLPNTELFGNCDLGGPRRYSVISGYALDTGVEIGDTGVGYVELLIDGSLWANSRVDCGYDPATGGLTDCYGLRRFDVEAGFPSLRDAPHSGFRFVLDIGFLLDFGYVPGFHVLTIRAGDVKGQVAEIAEVPVTFFCDDFIGNEGSFGDIDFPADPGRTVSGLTTWTGWALDWEGVADVQIFVDGVFIDLAERGLPRPGVTAHFPGYPDAALPGWRYILDTTTIANGTHQIQVVARDESPAAVETVIGERTFIVSNP
jgi:N-acetylmuramoyl-L-alanine amidase